MDGSRASASKTALVVGATGLVGSALTRQLLADAHYGSVVTFGRRELDPKGLPASRDKLTHHVIDFENTATYRDLLRGDVLFSALGTTIKTAGSQAAQYRVDHDYQLDFARYAHASGVGCLVLVSALGANPKSRVFYSRMKGELEAAIGELGFERTRILRPGMLDGDRQENRPGESFALSVMRLVPRWDTLAAIRPIHVEQVARAARSAAADETRGAKVLGPAELFGAADDSMG